MKLPNFGMAIVALIMSIAIWLYVEDQQALIATQTIKVAVNTFYSEPESESLYVLRRMPGPALVVLRGNQESLDRFNALYGLEKRGQETFYSQEPNGQQPRLYVQVDLSRLSLDQQTIRPERWQNKDLTQLKISVELPEIPILVEEKERKSVPVEVNPENLSESYQYDQAKSIVSPENVFVSGPKSLVTAVAKLVGTADFANYRPGSSLPVTRLQPQSASGELIGEVQVEDTAITVTPSLGPYMPRDTLVVTPTWRGRPAPGYRVFDFVIEPSPTVQVTGPRANQIDTLRTEPRGHSPNGRSP
jgi:YbbR domain-containing protein